MTQSYEYDNSLSVVDNAVASVRTLVPGFRIRNKKDYWFHRLFGRILRRAGNSNYMDVWTTLRHTAYRPDRPYHNHSWRTVLHEGRHAYRSTQITWPFMALIYLPTLWIPFVVAGMLFSPWFLFGVLLTWAPIPDYGRMKIELEAYLVEIAIKHWLGESITQKYIDDEIKNFTGPKYYWMWPFKKDMQRRFERGLADIKEGRIGEDRYLVMTKEFLESMKGV